MIEPLKLCSLRIEEGGDKNLPDDPCGTSTKTSQIKTWKEISTNKLKFGSVFIHNLLS